MDFFVFGVYVDIGRSMEGFFTVGMFSITEKYAYTRVCGIVRDSFPNHASKVYCDMDEWVADCASSLQPTEKVVGTYHVQELKGENNGVQI